MNELEKLQYIVASQELQKNGCSEREQDKILVFHEKDKTQDIH